MKEVKKVKKIHYEGLDVSNMVWQKEGDIKIAKPKIDENVEKREEYSTTNNERLILEDGPKGSVTETNTQALQGAVENVTKRGAKESDEFIKQLQLTNHTMLIQELNTKVSDLKLY